MRFAPVDRTAAPTLGRAVRAVAAGIGLGAHAVNGGGERGRVGGMVVKGERCVRVDGLGWRGVGGGGCLSLFELTLLVGRPFWMFFGWISNEFPVLRWSL